MRQCCVSVFLVHDARRKVNYTFIHIFLFHTILFRLVFSSDGKDGDGADALPLAFVSGIVRAEL